MTWRIFASQPTLEEAIQKKGAPRTLMLAASLLGGPPISENAATEMHSERSSGTVSTSVPATSSLTHHEATLYHDEPPAEDEATLLDVGACALRQLQTGPVENFRLEQRH